MGSSDQDNKNDRMHGISRQRKVIFNIIIVAFAFLIIVLFEFGLRIFKYGNDLDLFVESQNYPGYYEINRDVNLRYFTKTLNTSPTNDIFLIDKPDTCYRIFVFGGSTTRGFPYQAGTSFPRILYYQLQDAFPDIRIEVVNLSASAINSYTYIDMLDEVLKQQPDAILVYGGHNEYYGALGVGSVERGANARWIKKLRLGTCKLRSYQLVQNLIGKAGKKIQADNPGEATLMQRIVRDKAILMDSRLYQGGIDQFEANLTELIKKAGRKKVPVILSELVSNIHDQAPFKSIAEDKLPAAITLFNKAKQLEAEGDIDGARKLYYKAKDLDVIRFRAPEAFNDVLHELASVYDLPLVRMKQQFEDASSSRIVGNELLLEHLHPNLDGYFVMADAFFNSMREHNFIANEWNTEGINPISYYRANWGFTELDSLIGDLNIRHLKSGWPFRPENEPNRFIETYKVKSVVDSMAFAYLTKEDRHIEDEHIKLAGYYNQYGLPGKAFEEYFSLIKLHPYITDLYYDASRYLIQQKKYRETYELIQSAPLIKDDYYYYYMIGSMRVKLGMTDLAIKNLEKSLEIMPENESPRKILIPLYLAYKKAGDLQAAERTLELIRETTPDYGKETEASSGKGLAGTDVTYDDVLARARQLIMAGNFNSAEKLLLSLKKIEETFESSKLLGIAFLLHQKNDLAFEYCRKAYAFNPFDYENCNNLFIVSLRKGDLKTASLMLGEMLVMDISDEKKHQLQARFEARMNELLSE